MRIRARTDKLNTLLVAVTGFRQFSALEDLRLNTFAHGQEIGLPQLAIQETTFVRLERTFQITLSQSDTKIVLLLETLLLKVGFAYADCHTVLETAQR